MKYGFAPARRPAAAPPVEPRPWLRPFIRESFLTCCDGAVAALSLLAPRIALAAGEWLHRSLLARWVDLAPWRVQGSRISFELLEDRSWVEAIEDPARWPAMTGVDRNGRYEPAFFDAFWEHAQRARVVIDAGAARGLYSVLAALAGGPGEIHAFEPHAARRFVLRLNLLRTRTSKKIVIRGSFLGARDGKGVRTLDSYCRSAGITPDLVKMDIEGAEIELLEGARDVCPRHRPTLLTEFHQRRLREQGREPNRLLELLDEYGYQLRFNGHHGALENGDRTPDREWREEPPNESLTAVLAQDRQADGRCG